VVVARQSQESDVAVADGHAVLVTVAEDFEPFIGTEELRTIAARVFAAEGVPAAELSVLVADDETVRHLNREYAGEDASTDVLAFSLREGEEFVSPDEVQRLGEVIISYPTALRQAEDAGWPVEEEVAHLLVHGILHLLGYDHVQPEEERVMFARTDKLLAELA
jgi:probable rRNA maturation factor